MVPNVWRDCRRTSHLRFPGPATQCLKRYMRSDERPSQAHSAALDQEPENSIHTMNVDRPRRAICSLRVRTGWTLGTEPLMLRRRPRGAEESACEYSTNVNPGSTETAAGGGGGLGQSQSRWRAGTALRGRRAARPGCVISAKATTGLLRCTWGTPPVECTPKMRRQPLGACRLLMLLS